MLEALGLLTVDFPSDPAFFDRRNFLATLLYVDPKVEPVFQIILIHVLLQNSVP